MLKISERDKELRFFKYKMEIHMFNRNKLLLATSLLTMAGEANAAYTIKIDDDKSISFGGYIKADIRTTSGNVAARDYWIGTATVLDQSITSTNFAVNETRFNTKYVNGDVTGFIELDFYGAAVTGGYAGANEKFTNSSNPRIRHAFIKYKNLLVGQAWSTFVNTSALVEAADFGGPLVATAFIRQTQVRYSMGNLQVAIENPYTYGSGANPTEDKIPDVIVRYNLKGDWGNVSFSGLARQLNIADEFGGGTESAIGYGIAGRVKTFGKDDIRFQVHGGNTGRYVGVAAATDLVNGKVEDTVAVSVAYRHFWTENIRSTVFYGNTQTDLSDANRTHWGVNLFKNYTKQLSFGVELGNFEMANKYSASGDTKGGNSDYFQLFARYVL